MGTFSDTQTTNILSTCNQLLCNIAVLNMQYINPLTRYSKLTTNEEKKYLIMKANYELENMQMRRFISHTKNVDHEICTIRHCPSNQPHLYAHEVVVSNAAESN